VELGDDHCLEGVDEGNHVVRYGSPVSGPANELAIVKAEFNTAVIENAVHLLEIRH
jgi:hypothetical protein